jgi:cytochrome c553
MAQIVKGLTDDDLRSLSEHYSKLPARRSDEPLDDVLIKRGEEIAGHRVCRSCHLPTLAGQEQVPRLAKQRIDYLIQALKEFRDTTRPGGDTAMSANLAGASDDDLVALGHYSASK